MPRGRPLTPESLWANMGPDCRKLNAGSLGLGARLQRDRTQPLSADVLIIDLGGGTTSAAGIRHLTFPRLRLESEANRRDHWAVRHRRAKEQRYTVYYNLRCTYWPLPRVPCTITLTRIAPRLLDTDNLASSIKACQDGVADWLAGAEGHGQDRVQGLTWKYDQQQGQPREYGLRVTIEEWPL